MNMMQSSPLTPYPEIASGMDQAATTENWPGWASALFIIGSSSVLWALITLPFWI